MDSRIRPAKLATALVAAALLLAPSGVRAERSPFPLAPETDERPAARLALQYELKLAIPAGSDFAATLRDTGIADGDASAAERLAVADLAEGNGGCFAKLSVTKAVEGEDFRLVRVLLIMADGRQTIIERRGQELAIASKTPARKTVRLI